MRYATTCTSANAVALGMGISLIPDYMSATSGLSGKLHVLWEPAQPVTNELWLACHKAERGGRGVQLLLSALAAK